MRPQNPVLVRPLSPGERTGGPSGVVIPSSES
jgi:hypothetical protein